MVKRRLRWQFAFRWYDLWIGAYVDTKQRVLYICPLPMCRFRLWLEDGLACRRCGGSMERFILRPGHFVWVCPDCDLMTSPPEEKGA